MTYKYSEIDHGNYTKTFDAGKYVGDIPDTVDWRTSNAVTSIANQVCTILSNTHTYVTYRALLSLVEGRFSGGAQELGYAVLQNVTASRHPGKTEHGPCKDTIPEL